VFSNSLVSGWCRTLGPGFSYGPNSNKTDLRLSYVEQKTPGTKRVEALLFRIAPNPHRHRLLAPIPDASEEAAGQQPELFPGDQESEKYLEELQTTFKLSSPRLKRLRLVAVDRGMEYLKEKEGGLDVDGARQRRTGSIGRSSR
jgi:hypothetical protein